MTDPRRGTTLWAAPFLAPPTMKFPSRTRRTHVLPWIVASLVLFVLGMAPRSHVVVCLKKRGLAAAPAADCCTHCCEREAAAPAAPLAPVPGEERIGAGCPFGCCIDLQSAIELGPAPRGEMPQVPDLVVAAPPPLPALAHAIAASENVWPHDTGPPRVDAFTLLRSDTVLRL